MRRLACLTAILVPLALAAPAGAKGPVDVGICGSSGCKTFTWTPDLWEKGEVVAIGLLNTDAMEFAPAPAPGPFFELTLKADWLKDMRLFYVPGAKTLRAGSSWLQPDKKLIAALGVWTRGIAPFPRPTISHVFVNGRRATNPAAYASLLGQLPAADNLPAPAAHMTIILRADRPSPWTTVRRPLEYFPKFDLLHRHAEWVSVSPALAAQIESDAALVATAADSRSAWPSYLAAASLALALLAVIALNRRARRRARESATERLSPPSEGPPEPAA